MLDKFKEAEEAYKNYSGFLNLISEDIKQIDDFISDKYLDDFVYVNEKNAFILKIEKHGKGRKIIYFGKNFTNNFTEGRALVECPVPVRKKVHPHLAEFVDEMIKFLKGGQ